MSRVDEALRRAALEGASVEAPELADIVRLHDEAPEGQAEREASFPIEMPERRRPSAVITQAAPPAPAEPDRVEQVPLLRRLDASLAEKIIVDDRMLPASREQYRRLAAVLHDAQADKGLRVVMIASALAGEGKTLTASNLALTLSESYRRRVLLIDADLRRPTVHSVFRLDAATGLSDGLMATDDAKLLVRQVTPRLAVLPAGRPSPDPMAGLTSPRMQRLVGEAREAFDWVIIDTPPLVLLPDAHLLAPIADGIVLVVRANSTPHAMVSRSVEAVGRQRILGVVFNGAEDVRDSEYHDYYGYHAPIAGPGSTPTRR